MTRESYLGTLGLGPNATWEEVQSAYARLLEHHLAEQTDQASDELRAVEEAYGFLIQDSVIQARRSVSSTAKSTVNPRPHPIPVANPPTHGSDVNALILVLVCVVLLLVGAFAFLNRNIEARTVSSPAAPLEKYEQALAGLQRQNQLLSQQIDLLDVELARVQRQISENGTAESSKDVTTKSNVSSETKADQASLPIDESTLLSKEELNFQKLADLPPAAFTERDKLYVIQSNGELVQGYISITPALIDASIRCDVDQAKALLSDGLDVNQHDQRGDSALAWAVKRDCSPIVRLLLRQGVEVDSTSENGFTPYLWARLYNNQHMMQLLKRAGADTERGGYWWRTKEDGKKNYIERSLAAACRDPLASGCQN